MIEKLNIGIPEFIFIAIIALIIFIFLFVKIRNVSLITSVTSLWRGNRSERNLILRLRRFGFSKDEVFHDLYIPKSEGKYSQIDAVVVSDYGLIVFEVKDYSGWIYGNGYNPMWTQTFPRGRKNKFYNPILQNKNHIEALRRLTKKYGDIPFYSVIVFYGSSELKEITFIPENTFVAKGDKVKKALRRIRKQNPRYDYTDREAVADLLFNAVHMSDECDIQEQHVDNIKDSMGRDRIFD